jgi:hypothetical protein
MSKADPFMLISALAAVAVLLTPFASRMIANAAARLSSELGQYPDADLSRIRPRG